MESKEGVQTGIGMKKEGGKHKADRQTEWWAMGRQEKSISTCSAGPVILTLMQGNLDLKMRLGGIII